MGPKMTDARVILWARDIGAVSWDDVRQVGVFQYAPEFVESKIEIAPLTMPLRQLPFSFPALSKDTFLGMPGLLSDSLPDKFGNALIDSWLAMQGRKPNSFNPVERLCYIGARGMGALEFKPSIIEPATNARRLEVAHLVGLANAVLSEREALTGYLNQTSNHDTMEDIIRVGTSAGGARAKAVLAWNEETGEFRSGQIDAGEGFSPWLMKFDGITNNKDKELADPRGYGRIEFAYAKMAVAAGIDMTECRLHFEGGRAHFMTRRFDRTKSGGKLHMQSLGALMHLDFNAAGIHSYEQAMTAIRQLALPAYDGEQQLRRAVFNVLARNQDDHVKNIAFLMNKQGEWRLSPAFDVTYAFNPNGLWTNQHQMSINGKRDDFDLEDFIALGALGNVKPVRVKNIVNEVKDACERWSGFAAEAGVNEDDVVKIKTTFCHLAS